MPEKSVALLAALLVIPVLTASPATATHTSQPRKGITEVRFHPLLNTGFNTDVWAHPTRDGGLFAYVGTWGSLIGNDPCPYETDNPLNPRKSGVKIVDATKPARPELAAKLGTVPGSQNNDVKVAHIETGSFEGDILSHSLEPSGTTGAFQGDRVVRAAPRRSSERPRRGPTRGAGGQRRLLGLVPDPASEDG